MPLPPPLSAASNERMFAVLDRAGPAVDGGADPNAALAKAAAALALPPGHVPLLVRAFNTGRAARQLAEGGDAWSKAAHYPVADTDRVTALMSAPEPAGPCLTDYAAPPRTATKRAAQAPTLPPLPDAVKQATVAAAAPPPPARVNRLDLQYKAAAAADQASEELARLTPARYKAAKAAAARYAPDAAAYLFGRLEAEQPHFTRLAERAKAARADPAFPADHPAVLAVLTLDRVKAAYPAEAAPTPPAGFGPSPTRPGFWERLPVCPLLGVPVPFPKAAAAAPPPDPPAPPLLLDRPLDKEAVDDGKKDPAPRSWLTGFGRGLGAGAWGVASKGLNAIGTSDLLRLPEGAKKPESNVLDRTRQDIGRIGDQAALQDLMTDPRFRNADPTQLLEAYRQYAGLAPLAMRNPAVAGDFLNRRLMTGPLSAYEMKNLTDIEHNLARITRVRRGDDDED